MLDVDFSDALVWIEDVMAQQKRVRVVTETLEERRRDRGSECSHTVVHVNRNVNHD